MGQYEVHYFDFDLFNFSTLLVYLNCVFSMVFGEFDQIYNKRRA